jgi:hypothetical protein
LNALNKCNYGEVSVLNGLFGSVIPSGVTRYAICHLLDLSFFSSAFYLLQKKTPALAEYGAFCLAVLSCDKCGQVCKPARAFKNSCDVLFGKLRNPFSKPRLLYLNYITTRLKCKGTGGRRASKKRIGGSGNTKPGQGSEFSRVKTR